MLLLGIGVLVAFVRVLAVSLPQRIVWGDEPFYLWLGRNWLTGRGYSFTGYSDIHHTPGYPFLSGIFYLITGNLELASDICYVLFGTLLAIPIYGLAKEMYGRAVGLTSVALLAIFPAVATAPALWGTLTEPPYYFFVYAGLLTALLAMRRETIRLHLLSGVCFGLAYLVRPEAVAYVAAVAAVLGLVRLSERRLLSRRILLSLLALAVGFLLLFMPYAFYVYLETGEWMVSEKAGVTFVTCLGLSEGNTRAFDEATWGLDSTGREVFFFSRESYDVSMLDVIMAYPADFVQLVVRNARRFIASLFSSRLFPYYFLPLIGLAFFQSAWDKKRLKGELLLIASLAPVLVFLLFFIQDRYIATLLPTLVIWLALGVHQLGQWLRLSTRNVLADHPRWADQFSGWASLLPLVATLLYFLLLQPRMIELYGNIGSFRPEHKTIGLWMREHIPADSVVMSRYPAIAFYADMPWEPTANAELDALLIYARAQHVDYFVLDERETRDLRPQFAALFDTSTISPSLQLVHMDPGAGERIAIFALNY